MAGPSGSSESSMTSTSHTLTNTNPPSFAHPSKPPGAMEMLALFEAIKSGNRHDFLQPSSSLPTASLQLAKSTLDAYAAQVSDEQQQRQKEANKKRKRADGPSKTEVLKVRNLHVDGFESGQVWQQAKRIITSTLQDSKDTLQELEDRNEVQLNGVNGASDDLEVEGSDFETGSINSGQFPASEEDGSEGGLEVGDEDEYSDEDGLEDDVELLEDGMEEEDENIDMEEEDMDDKSSSEEAAEPLVKDPNGLNDGFFSIDDFNKQTQFFEDADARADPNADEASDDDELDWHADPFSASQPADWKKSKKSRDEDDELPSGLIEDDEEEEDDNEDDEEGGATFGDMDLDAPEGDSENEGEDDAMDDGDEFNANDVFYKDFFAPPQRKGAKKSKSRGFENSKSTQPDDGDIDRAKADVRRDLFEDESEHENSDDALSDVSAGDPKSRRSAHERRQAKLTDEIRKLEAANVAKRDWTLSGEAKATQRPMNSLLEEDLDFEHVGKPVPVITTEVSESLEDLIKRRILAQEFDEVIRRRPDSAEFSTNARRGLVEVDDSKGKQGLAELYEEEHTKNANPDTYVSKADAKLQKEEKEVEQLWAEVSAKLDALSSWHYKPKPPAPSLTVVSDIATISMEDAQPTTAQGVSGGDNTLAPQEIYKAGKDTAEKGEVVAKSGLPVARQEMSREDKAKRRRREKERTRKAGGTDSKKPQSAKARERKDTLGDLKKGGVKVINKKGEIVDMEGNKARAAKAASSGSFKL
ncbi:Uu.00g105170.m01.CDS01 [Anthostomella pinea]|uniref:U3 small nucleolar ribonucleoprotein protein MPP10 n=1 Tax=Anthostomella pinea TaxID=933095 RepID=A0AAI8VDY8_9PEZI|nr:Uu.00g105170.m01.CDS01 [Anthostomella pinea]